MGKKKPRRIRYPAITNVMEVVKSRVATLNRNDLAEIFATLKEAMKSMKMGHGTQENWSVLAGMLEVALAIEKTGIVKGLSGHLEDADKALKSIYSRAMAESGWESPTLYWHEMEAIQLFIELHEFQAKQLGSVEFDHAVELASNEIRKQGCGHVYIQSVSSFRAGMGMQQGVAA